MCDICGVTCSQGCTAEGSVVPQLKSDLHENTPAAAERVGGQKYVRCSSSSQEPSCDGTIDSTGARRGATAPNSSVPKHVKHRLAPRYEKHRPSVVAEALAAAIMSGADGCESTTECEVETETLPSSDSHNAVTPKDVPQQRRQVKTATYSGRRASSARARLQHRACTSIDVHQEPCGTMVNRSGALSVPPPPLLQRQQRRGRSAGVVRTHGRFSMAGDGIESVATFRGTAAVYPRTGSGYFRPAPPDNQRTVIKPVGATSAHDQASSTEGVVSDREEDSGIPTQARSAASFVTQVEPMSRLLPLFSSSVVEPTKAALPYTPERLDRHRPKTATIAAASAAAARYRTARAAF